MWIELLAYELEKDAFAPLLWMVFASKELMPTQTHCMKSNVYVVFSISFKDY